MAVRTDRLISLRELANLILPLQSCLATIDMISTHKEPHIRIIRRKRFLVCVIKSNLVNSTRVSVAATWRRIF